MTIKPLSSKIRAKLWCFSRGLSIAMLIHCLLWSLRGPFARSDFGRDELCCAAYVGNIYEMQFLLEAGADPDSVGWDDHLTPLGRAVWSKKLDAIRLLLAWNANPSAKDDFGNEAVSYLSSDDERTSDATKNEIVALLNTSSRKN